MYHLSYLNLGIKALLVARHPGRSYSEERQPPARVYFSPTIEQAVFGVEGVFDSNKEDAYTRLVKSIKFHQNLILEDFPSLKGFLAVAPIFNKT